ncbi:cytochrome P450 [Aspergillus affinis]|uniref:cytochrome P450 n=1 Tax=Aspergillus affinis TaxID=1070780 RepID=UPI0022FE23AB|nr:cytochrome P450 [Aspergillus affinis]KAI9039000.1 cytochrome P450 [Aspergillus affinis]
MSDSPAEAPQYPPGYMEADKGNQVIAVVSFILVLGTILLALRLASVMAEDPKKIVNYSKLLYTLFWVYVPSNALSRVSVVALYLRIFTSRFYRSMCWVVIAFLLGHMLITLITAQLECLPLAYTWDKSIPGGRCINKILYGLFASCMRTGIFFRDSHIIATDPTWATDVMCWTIVESGMYFSAACLIGMRPLFSKLPRWLRNRILHPSKRGTADQDSRSGTGLGFNKGPSHHPYSSLSGGRDTPGQATQLKSMNAITNTIVSPRGSGFDDDSVRNIVADDGDIRVQTRIEVRSDRSRY